ncbi:MAG: RidA family protein [bacterium]|nr:RidA family protein [bacterium]
MSVDDRLKELNITLPPVPAPAGNYAHAVRSGNQLYLSGKGPGNSTGKVGADVTTEQAHEDARKVGLILLAVLKDELGSLDRVKQVVKVLGMVNATPDFKEHPQVINGCSDLFVEVFGDQGKHARSAIGMGSLPNMITVEIEAIVEITD